MTKQPHLITPSPELFTEWLSEALLQHDAKPGTVAAMVADKAAQWGADQELETCCEWLCTVVRCKTVAERLRSARRPKPPSLKEQALAVIENSSFCDHLSPQDAAIIRRALEALDD